MSDLALDDFEELIQLWAIRCETNQLTRTFEFQDFVASLGFVNSLIAYFEPSIIILIFESPMVR